MPPWHPWAFWVICKLGGHYRNSIFLAIAHRKHEIKWWKWCLHLGFMGLRFWLGHCRNGQTVCIGIDNKYANYGFSLPLVNHTATSSKTLFCGGEPYVGVPTKFFCSSYIFEGCWSRIRMMSPCHPLAFWVIWKLRRPLPKFHFWP